MKTVTGFLFLACAVAAPGIARAQDSGIEIGKMAPAAALQTLDGKAADLGSKNPLVYYNLALLRLGYLPQTLDQVSMGLSASDSVTRRSYSCWVRR